ncbi:MAG: hypothetical protein HY036_03175 [Nitrospirae bacterium]|nr:hypothetical protein [Nitrospirota bacterium]MBI3351557.1 hypothetical protein [Nitrospirota bacterium]
MKKVKGEELRTEYLRKDLGKGIRGKYLKAYRSGTNLVLLKPEVASVFPTEQAVNEALSSLINVAQHAVVLKKHPTKRAKAARS